MKLVKYRFEITCSHLVKTPNRVTNQAVVETADVESVQLYDSPKRWIQRVCRGMDIIKLKVIEVWE